MSAVLDNKQLHAVVMKLIGPVHAIGDHNADQQRLENLKMLTVLVDDLLCEIADVAPSADRHEASMKNIGTHARDFLKDVKEADLA